ncbi:response regulator [Sinorhizobium meliloti]|uniref:response regulator transcription factor n=1 Tax=Rhizobium meliloti TaxID=382 RepID=UPI00237F450C|nr:response regulator [Sinorhizobium meliloti]MDE3812186.1 response regulator [Sinorhizobium meliloti]
MPTHHVVSIIDDEITVRRGTSSFLRSLGFLVKTYVSAEEFLNSGDIESCSCIVSDVHMPGMSGIDLYEKLRTRKPLPFIFITAFSEEIVRLRVGQGVRILQKPFQPDRLADCIREAIAGT